MSANIIRNDDLIWDCYDPLQRPGPTCPSCDVEITIKKSGTYADGKTRLALSYICSRQAARKISPNTGYGRTAVYEDNHRVYFKEGSKGRGNGYKLSATPNSDRLTLRYTIYEEDHWSMLKGEYLLFYDNKRKLYYIDLKKNLKKTSNNG